MLSFFLPCKLYLVYAAVWGPPWNSTPRTANNCRSLWMACDLATRCSCDGRIGSAMAFKWEAFATRLRSWIGWDGMWQWMGKCCKKKTGGLSSKGLISLNRHRCLSSWIGDFSFGNIEAALVDREKNNPLLYYVTLFFIQGDWLNFMEYTVGMVPKSYSWPRGQCPCFSSKPQVRYCHPQMVTPEKGATKRQF